MKLTIRILFWTGVAGLILSIAQLLFEFSILRREQGMLEILPFPGEWGIILIIFAGGLLLLRVRELRRQKQTRE